MSAMSARDIASRGFTLLLQKLSRGRAGQVAKEMGVADSQVSDLKNKQAEQVLLLAAHLGLKLVPADAVVVGPAVMAFLTESHKKMLRHAPDLLWSMEEPDFQGSGFGNFDEVAPR